MRHRHRGQQEKTIMMMHTEAVEKRVGMTPLVPADVSRAPSLQDWADRITHASAEAVEAILAVGRLLIDAKKALPHGVFGRLFRDHTNPIEHPVRYSVATARMLMTI